MQNDSTYCLITDKGSLVTLIAHKPTESGARAAGEVLAGRGVASFLVSSAPGGTPILVSAIGDVQGSWLDAVGRYEARRKSGARGNLAARIVGAR